MKLATPGLLDRILGPAPVEAAVPASRPALALKWTASPFNGSGYARVSRELLPALHRRGVDLQLEAWGSDPKVVADIAADPRRKAAFDAMLRRRLDHGVHVLFHPPRSHGGEAIFRNARANAPQLETHAGYTMFETDRMPPGWAEECAAMDAVLVPSTFVRDVFARCGVSREKLFVLPHGLDWEPYDRARPDFAIPERRGFAFLSVFEWTLRKGWDVLLDAWAEAFSPADDVTLVIRASVPKGGPDVERRIDEHYRARGLARRDVAHIAVIDAFVPEARMPALYASCDAFVLPTRGEGFGLPYLEALGSGLPTIATRWSGQLDVLRDADSWLIDVEGMESVDARQVAENPYFTSEHLWARPSTSALCTALRDVFDRPDAARAKAARGRARVRAELAIDRVAGIAEAGLLGIAERVGAARTRAMRGEAPSRVVWKANLDGISGFADEARQFVLGLDEIGRVPAAAPVRPGAAIALPGDEAARLAAAARRVPAGRFVLVHHLLPRQLAPLGGRAIDVARVMFETDGLPAAVVERLERFEEIWVPSAFNVDTFARAGLDAARLHVIPEALDARAWEPRARPLAIEGRRGFNVLSVFDWSLRKGWDVLLRAWAEAFTPADDVALILKVHASNGLGLAGIQRQIEAFCREHLGRTAAELADIVLLDARIPAAGMPRLYASADLFVLPTRGEGWGRPLMEAMAQNVPVVATGWSGLTAFLDDETGWPLPYTLAAVSRAAVAETPLFAAQRWAEPDPSALAALLRHAATPSAAPAFRRRAARARARVLTDFDRRAVARKVAVRIDAALRG